MIYNDSAFSHHTGVLLTYLFWKSQMARLQIKRALEISAKYDSHHMLTNLTVGRPHFTLWSNVPTECLLV